MSHWHLNGKRALITGGTRGVGAATVRELRALGAEVLYAARTVDGSAECIAADVSTPAGRASIAAAVRDRWGALDILVNNAGMNIRKPWVQLAPEEQATVIGTNLLGPAELLRQLHPLLAKGAAPAVVNVASVAAYVDVGSGAAYALSKAAMVQLTRSLAVEWAADGIRVNAVAPWYIRTPLTEPVLSQPDRLERILARTPMKRVGEPAEVAAAIAFLCMDKASFITGHCLVADGGLLALGL
jgi:Tropinone reductase 1